MEHLPIWVQIQIAGGGSNVLHDDPWLWQFDSGKQHQGALSVSVTEDRSNRSWVASGADSAEFVNVLHFLCLKARIPLLVLLC